MTENTVTDRSGYNLYMVTIKRAFTDEYKQKWGGSRDEEFSSYLTWNSDLDTARTRASEVHDVWPTKYASFDKMYRESLVMVEELTPDDLENRRITAQRYTRCCELGVIRNCVCSYSITCPVHGSKCVGSHD